jgi:hypothetical protein
MRALLIAIFATYLAAITATNAQPLTPRIPPPSLYPPHSLIQVANPVDNTAMDCAWSFDCANGWPNTHTKSPTDLGRLSGWMAHGTWQHQDSQISITLWGSIYATWRAARAAMSDFNYEAQQPSPILTPLLPCPSPLTLPNTGRATCFRYLADDGLTRVFEFAVRQGPIELEMLLITNTRYAEARRYAFQQLQYAMGNG